MTREEREDAIDIIQSILNKYEEDECLVTEIPIGDEDIKAFKMAIEALEQEPNCSEIPTDSTTRNCFGCKYSKDNHNAGTEECHLCMWENQYTLTTKNDLGVQ